MVEVQTLWSPVIDYWSANANIRIQPDNRPQPFIDIIDCEILFSPQDQLIYPQVNADGFRFYASTQFVSHRCTLRFGLAFDLRSIEDPKNCYRLFRTNAQQSLEVKASPTF